MAVTIQGTTYDGQARNVSVEPPDRCPICHAGIDPRPMTAAISISVPPPGQALYAVSAQVVFRCTLADCRRVFIGYYSPAPNTGSLNEADARYWKLARVVPTECQARVFDASIGSTSTMFVRIYNQALSAENAGLDQI
jgi:hypothetical protein